MDTTTVKSRDRTRHESHQVHEQVAARLTAQDIRAIDQLVTAGFFLNRSDFLRTAAREKLRGIEVIELRQVGPRQARKEILDYLRSHPGSYPSDVAQELRLDLRLVMKVCRELLDQGQAEEGTA